MLIDMVGDLDAALGFDPFMRVRQTGVGADDSDDTLSGGSDGVGVFEDEFEDGAKILAALGVEAGSAGVTVNRRPV